jgi:transmembrane sensor
MPQTLFWNLLAKKLAGEATPGELEQLDELMREHPEWMYPAQHIQDLWNLKSVPQNPQQQEEAFARHLEHMKQKGIPIPSSTPEEPDPFLQPPKKRSRRLLIPIAALFVLAVVLLAVLRPDAPPPATKQVSEVQTRAGSRTRLMLPDSSTVWLNAGSKLSYGEGFGISNRELTLSGEAYFDVKKSKTPFIINTSAIRITVLGTAFNVKSYPNEKTTETSLVRGKVEVTVNNRPGEKFLLEPNEKLVVANRTQETAKSSPGKKEEPLIVLGKITHLEDNSIVETSWIDNKLVFMDESFAEVAAKMERWYNVEIKITDEKIAAARLTGTFENESVTQALKALQITTPFRFTQEQNRITITQ